MYFTAPSGRPIDVMVDRLTMCHTLDFRPSFGRLPLTVDVVDMLLSKLQIVELNEKDARDIVHLLARIAASAAGGPARPSTPGGSARCSARTGGGGGRSPSNLAKLPALIAEKPGPGAARAAVRPGGPGPASCCEIAEAAPKGVKWKLRANVGDRVRWYELPEEVAH